MAEDANWRKTMAGKIVFCWLLSFGWVSLAAAQSKSPVWSWEFVASHVPKFEEKPKESQRMLVVEIVFRNKQETDQKLIVAQEEFHATDQKGRPLEIVGLLWRMQKLEGAKQMVYTGGMKRMETLNEVQGDSTTFFVHSPGPVEVIIEGGRSYKQWLLLSKPKGKNPFRLKFDDLPELEITVPR